MSIWSSVRGDDIKALNNDTEASNYRGEGEPNLTLDVATTWHELMSLRIFELDVDVLLSVDAAEALRDRIDKALPVLRRERSHREKRERGCKCSCEHPTLGHPDQPDICEVASGGQVANPETISVPASNWGDAFELQMCPPCAAAYREREDRR